MPGIYHIKIKNGLVYKYLIKDKFNEIAHLISENLKKKTHLHYFNQQITKGHTKPYIGKHIVKGMLFRSRGDYISPYINGNLVSEIKIYSLNLKHLIELFYSLTELLINITIYNKDYYLTGDWASHNLKWSKETGLIINIDLEGFYTYSNIGPVLPWEKKENTIKFIKNNIKKLQKSILSQIIKKINYLDVVPYLTLIYLPCNSNIQLLFPFYLNNTRQNLNPFKFNIDFGDLEGYPSVTYKVFMLIKNQLKPSIVIVKDTQTNSLPIFYQYLFKFKASTSQGYEHPIPVKVYKKHHPTRSIFQFLDEDKKGDFYIKKFFR